jgi:uncharacterized MAPEG superfamily protein
MLEEIFRYSPIRFNAVLSLPILLTLAFIPQLLRREIVIRRLKELGKTYSIALSRYWGAVAGDSSDLGQQIAVYSGCHQNGLEAFSFFSVAILLGLNTNLKSDILDGAAGLFLLARIAYTIVYLTPSLNGFNRTVCWAIGMIIILLLMIVSGLKYAQDS